MEGGFDAEFDRFLGELSSLGNGPLRPLIGWYCPIIEGDVACFVSIVSPIVNICGTDMHTVVALGVDVRNASSRPIDVPIV